MNANVAIQVLPSVLEDEEIVRICSTLFCLIQKQENLQVQVPYSVP